MGPSIGGEDGKYTIFPFYLVIGVVSLNLAPSFNIYLVSGSPSKHFLYKLHQSNNNPFMHYCLLKNLSENFFHFASIINETIMDPPNLYISHVTF